MTVQAPLNSWYTSVWTGIAVHICWEQEFEDSSGCVGAHEELGATKAHADEYPMSRCLSGRMDWIIIR
jgi:hypothetical protein